MEQAQQVATQETAPAAAALPTPSQGKKSCKTFKKVENLPANRGPRKPCKSILKRKKKTCAPRRKKKSLKKEEEEDLEEKEGEEVLQEEEKSQEGEEEQEE